MTVKVKIRIAHAVAKMKNVAETMRAMKIIPRFVVQQKCVEKKDVMNAERGSTSVDFGDREHIGMYAR